MKKNTIKRVKAWAIVDKENNQNKIFYGINHYYHIFDTRTHAIEEMESWVWHDNSTEKVIPVLITPITKVAKHTLINKRR